MVQIVLEVTMQLRDVNHVQMQILVLDPFVLNLKKEYAPVYWHLHNQILHNRKIAIA